MSDAPRLAVAMQRGRIRLVTLAPHGRPALAGTRTPHRSGG